MMKILVVFIVAAMLVLSQAADTDERLLEQVKRAREVHDLFARTSKRDDCQKFGDDCSMGTSCCEGLECDAWFYGGTCWIDVD